MANPVPSHPRVTTPYGKPGSWAAGYHTGDDYGSSGINGAKVVATADATVVYSGFGGGWGSAYGSQVILDTGGRRHMYAHLSRRTVSYGQRVKAGAQIGNIGSTGNSTGPHLHYEERVGSYRYGSDARKPILSAGAVTPPPSTNNCFGDYCYGKEAAAHRALQRRLKEKGHDPGYGDWPTTLYGDGTKNAVAAFQRAQGWSGSGADGLMGPGTCEKLGLPQSLAYRSSKQVYASKMRVNTGDSDSVWNVQAALLLKGYSIPAGPTDYFGGQTVDAVKKFQQDQGWSGDNADGIPGPGTVKALGLQWVQDVDEEPDVPVNPPVPPPSGAPDMPPGCVWDPVDGKNGLRPFAAGGEPKIVLHTTETDNDVNWHAKSSGHPHFTFLKDNTSAMMLPLDVAAYTLAGGAHSPNSGAGVVIQIEMTGRASEVPGWSQERFDALKELLVWITAQIKGTYVFPAPFTDDRGYGSGGAVRLDWDRFRATKGVVGHSHAPFNDHWDPGDLPTDKLSDRVDPPDPVEPPVGGTARALLLANGWDDESDDEVNTALGVMWCESHGYTDAVGDIGLINEKWGPSVGLPQIRTLQEVENWAGQPDGVRDINVLRDPGEQVRAMQVLKNQYGWQQWSTHPDSAERKGRDPIKDYECFHEAKGKDFELRTGHENAGCWSLAGCDDGSVPPPIEPPPVDPPTSELGDAALRAELSSAFTALAHAIDNLE